MATEGVKGGAHRLRLFPLPPCRLRRGEIPYLRERAAMVARPAIRSRPSARHSIDVEESSLGARLRTREVTGRDASLPAPLLSAFGVLVARGTVGALPQTPPEAPPLDSARGRRKGTKSPPLDPFRAIELVTLPYFFRVFILLFTLYFNLSANDVAPNRSGSPSHSAHVAPISA